MARPPRDLAPGIQHIGVSAAGPTYYFRDDVDHMTWTRLFVRTLERYGWICIGVCEMSTHWHAIVDIPDGSLSAGMQSLTGEYSKRFNARHGRVGYLGRRRQRPTLNLDPLHRQPAAMRTGPRVSVQLHPGSPPWGRGAWQLPASKETRMEQRSQELQLARRYD